MNYRDVMDMPVKAFWQLSGTVERLWADERKAALEIAVVAQSQDGAQDLYARLDSISPTPVQISGKALMLASAVRDTEGFEELRAMTI